MQVQTPHQISGQREKNKLEKLQRIRDTTRELFVEKGYDETTTREIAVRAAVGIGTVFTYAENKRDLLFLIANDELDAVATRCEAGVSDRASCLQNLLTIFRQHYRFFAKQPALSRLLLREMTFYRLWPTGAALPEDAGAEYSVGRPRCPAGSESEVDQSQRGSRVRRLGRILRFPGRTSPLADDRGTERVCRNGQSRASASPLHGRLGRKSGRFQEVVRCVIGGY